MRAMVLDAPKKLLQLRDVANPRPNAGQLLVRVSACAVCAEIVTGRAAV